MAEHLTVSSSVCNRPFIAAGAATGWVGETDELPVSGASKIAELSCPTVEIYACPAAAGKLLDDAAFDVDKWLNRGIVDAFAKAEGKALVTGAGINEPKGFLAYNQVVTDVLPWGKLGYVASGVSGGLPAEYPADEFYDLVFSLEAAYRRNGRFVMNRMSQSAKRRITDDNGNYIWQPDRRQPASHLARFPGRGMRQHADHRTGRGHTHLQRLRARLSGGRSPRRPGAARSRHRQAISAVLRPPARRRLHQRLQSNQAHYVRGASQAPRNSASPRLREAGLECPR